jgi:hypothetical protein
MHSCEDLVSATSCGCDREIALLEAKMLQLPLMQRRLMNGIITSFHGETQHLRA